MCSKCLRISACARHDNFNSRHVRPRCQRPVCYNAFASVHGTMSQRHLLGDHCRAGAQGGRKRPLWLLLSCRIYLETLSDLGTLKCIWCVSVCTAIVIWGSEGCLCPCTGSNHSQSGQPPPRPVRLAGAGLLVLTCSTVLIVRNRLSMSNVLLSPLMFEEVVQRWI